MSSEKKNLQRRVRVFSGVSEGSPSKDCFLSIVSGVESHLPPEDQSLIPYPVRFHVSQSLA